MVSEGTKRGLVTAGIGVGGFLGGMAVGHFAGPVLAEVVSVPQWAKDAVGRIDVFHKDKYLTKHFVSHGGAPNPNIEKSWESCTYVLKQAEGLGVGVLFVERYYLFGVPQNELWIVTKNIYREQDIVFDGVVVASLAYGLPGGWKKQIML